LDPNDALARIRGVSRAVALFTFALTLPAASAAHPSDGHSVALVTAETENRLIAVSLPSGRVLRRISVSPDPQNVVANGRKLVVLSPGSGAVTLVDARTLRIEKTLRGFGAPHLATLTPDGRWAFVTDDPRGQLDVVSLTSDRVVKRLYVGLGAHHLTLSGRRLWIALGEHARSIVIVDVSRPARPRLLRRFDPGFVAHDLAFTPNGRRVWITSSADAFVRVVDARTLRVLRTVYSGPAPQHLTFVVHTCGLPSVAYVTSGYGERIEAVDPASGRIFAVGRVPYGSFNLASAGHSVVTASLLNGAVTELGPRLAIRESVTVAPSTRGIASVLG
jgi:WD40 repeat protein